jgi:hypothetical protein
VKKPRRKPRNKKTCLFQLPGAQSGFPEVSIIHGGFIGQAGPDIEDSEQVFCLEGMGKIPTLFKKICGLNCCLT